jgi:hypothetical protein
MLYSSEWKDFNSVVNRAKAERASEGFSYKRLLDLLNPGDTFVLGA